MEHEQSKAAKPSNDPTDRLSLPENMDRMSASELAAAFEQALDATTDATYDGALVDAYLEFLDQKAPMPEAPEENAAYAAFCDRVQSTFSPITATEPQEVPKPRRRSRRLLHTALIAVVMVAAVFGSMVVAQAAGADVFGAIARWTEEAFSFGVIREETDTGAVKPEAEQAATEDASAQAESVDYTSLQDVLDAYGITEVTAPTWLPDGYTFSYADAVQLDDWVYIYATYTDGVSNLDIDISKLSEKTAVQYEKTDAPVEIVSHNGQEFYEFFNTDNNVVAWATSHYECGVTGKVEADELQSVAFSMSVESAQR